MGYSFNMDKRPHPHVLACDDLGNPGCVEHIARCVAESRPLVAIVVSMNPSMIDVHHATLLVDYGIAGLEMPPIAADFLTQAMREAIDDDADATLIHREPGKLWTDHIALHEVSDTASRICHLLELDRVPTHRLNNTTQR